MHWPLCVFNDWGSVRLKPGPTWYLHRCAQDPLPERKPALTITVILQDFVRFWQILSGEKEDPSIYIYS